MHDRLALGVLSGVAAQAIKWPLSTLAFLTGISQQVDPHIAAGIWLSEAQAMTLFGYAYGTLGTFIIASVIGVVLVYVLSITGDDWWWLKGGGVAALALVGGFGILLNVGGSRVNPIDMGSVITNTFLYILWGVLAAYFAIRWGSEELFRGVEKLD